ncbi:4-hydroxy-tetrahydrodipicolinate reductase [subsurface metagenome]
MGRVVARAALQAPDFEVVAGIDPAEAEGEKIFPVYRNLESCGEKADVVIDFSHAEALPSLLKGAVQKGLPLVIATTGFSSKDKQLIEAESAAIPIFQAANMSLGINLVSELIRKAALALGSAFDIEIIEKHHNLKKDAPSGTALALADSINSALPDPKKQVFGRHTRTERRAPEEIGIHAIRGGTIVGEHTVLFAGKDEVVEIKHTAYSKQIFAAGALKAARFLKDRTAGFYTMKELINS